MTQVLIILGTLLPVVSTVVYIASIARGVSKPQRMTRLLLMVISGLALVALVAGNSSVGGIWLAAASFVQAVIVWALSLKYGVGGKDRLDAVCFVLCAVGLVGWILTGESLVGLLTAIVTDLIAVLPSLFKTIRMPHTESWLFYALDTVASVFIMVATPFVLRDQLYPAYLLAINALFVGVIWLVPHRRKLRGVDERISTPLG